VVRPAELEFFDDRELLSRSSDPANSEAWQQGYAAGHAEATQQALANNTQLQDSVVQALQEMAFGFAEARALLVNDLRPLFEASCAQFFPVLADAALPAQIVSALMDLAEERVQQPLKLHLPPDQVTAVNAALTRATALPFEAVADPALGPNQAIIVGGAQDVMIDFDGLTSLVRSSFEAVTEPTQERQDHG